MELADYKNSNKLANPYTVKCVLLGQQGVGKSTMLGILTTGRFNHSIVSTIAIDFAIKKITLPDYNNHQIKLQIWDTAGQEKFKSIARSYLRDVYIAFLIFDVTDRNSWDSLEEWKKELETNSYYDNLPLMVLVGTKSDLKGRAITSEEIEERSKEWECKSYVVSAKQNNSQTMIYRLFTIAAEDLHQLIVYKHINGKELPSHVLKKTRSNTHKIYYWDEEKPKWCCF